MVMNLCLRSTSLYVTVILLSFAFLPGVLAQQWSRDSIVAAYQQGFKLSQEYKHEQAEELFTTALEQSKSLGDSTLIGRGYTELAEIYLFENNLSQAEEYAEQGLQYLQHQNDTAPQLKSSGLLGTIYSEQGKYTQALEEYRKALKLAEASGRDEEYYGVLFNMTSTYSKIGRYKDALADLQNARSITRPRETWINWPPSTIILAFYILSNCAKPLKPWSTSDGQ